MPNIHEPQLVNLIGHSAGAVIFGIFLLLLLRDRAAVRLRASWPSITAAALAFLWNVGSLAVLMYVNAYGVAPRVLIAFSFSVLSFIPAVLLHLSLDGRFPIFTAFGYALSATAMAMHFYGLGQYALLLITIGFGLLTVAALIGLAAGREADKRRKTSRMLGAMCAALFAMSFVHIGAGHASIAWSKELILHHAGIPLALFVLLQDYRFVLLDAFLRFLTNVLLAIVLTSVVIRMGIRLVPGVREFASNPSVDVFLLVAMSAVLIVFAVLRAYVQRLLTRAVFRRPDLEKAMQQFRAMAAIQSNEPDYLTWAADEMARYMGTSGTLCVTPFDVPVALSTRVMDIPAIRGLPEYQRTEAVVPIRIAPHEVRCVLLGRRRGGRRYLSEDLHALDRLAAVVVEEVERFRRSEMQQLVSQAELRALQSQINPHFLFNALNTLYGTIPREIAGARRTVMNLAEIFRYSLQNERVLIPLSEEMGIVRAYLEIEALRLGPRLHTEIDVDDGALAVRIPVLSIQPLVENAVKHGLALSPKEGWLRLKVKVMDACVRITIEDTGPGVDAANLKHNGTGIGLANVSKRLHLCYGPDVNLDIVSDAGGTKVQFCVPFAIAEAV